MMHVTDLKWDSAFFGFDVAKINCDQPFDEKIKERILELAKNNVKLVYYFTMPQNPVPDEKLRLLNGKLVDKKITFYKNIVPTAHDVNENVVLYEKKQTDPVLINLALSSGAHSRFKIDQNFPQYSFEKLYSLWITRSASGEIADYVFVYKANDNISGLITLKAGGQEAAIGLLSVDQNVQGKGIGRSLIQRVENACIENGIRGLSVATQGDNTLACQFYLKTGFQIIKQELVYHFWLDHENTI
jgi:dTDP-4-amino-4,6-dideoxy-D-galactose acyltransferase